MMVKRVLVVGGLMAALAVPAGVAVAAAASPGPGAAGAGSGAGPMPGGRGDPADCLFHDSAQAQAQAWRAQRAARQTLPAAERQRLADQHREQMWTLRAAATPPS
jgi:Spy/CpxP family protein refolding chaperone